jgi:hypothetical protein
MENNPLPYLEKARESTDLLREQGSIDAATSAQVVALLREISRLIYDDLHISTHTLDLEISAESESIPRLIGQIKESGKGYLTFKPKPGWKINGFTAQQVGYLGSYQQLGGINIERINTRVETYDSSTIISTRLLNELDKRNCWILTSGEDINSDSPLRNLLTIDDNKIWKGVTLSMLQHRLNAEPDRPHAPILFRLFLPLELYDELIKEVRREPESLNEIIRGLYPDLINNNQLQRVKAHKLFICSYLGSSIPTGEEAARISMSFPGGKPKQASFEEYVFNKPIGELDSR